MQPLAAYKPPLENRETEDLFERVYASLNDIDRSKPLSSDAQRVNEILNAYSEVRAKYIAEATALGVIDWFEYTFCGRRFMVVSFVSTSLDELRPIYNEMERLGFPWLDPLISMRLTWVRLLHGAGYSDEAKSTAEQLRADLREFERRYPGTLPTKTPTGVEAILQELGC